MVNDEQPEKSPLKFTRARPPSIPERSTESNRGNLAKKPEHRIGSTMPSINSIVLTRLASLEERKLKSSRKPALPSGRTFRVFPSRFHCMPFSVFQTFSVCSDGIAEVVATDLADAEGGERNMREIT